MYLGSLTGIGSSGKKGVVKPHLCKSCGETSPEKFYPKMKITCKKCHSKTTHKRRLDIRQQAIQYKGGKCQHCGYDRYPGALHFHHKDPSKKDLEQFSRWKNFDALKPEIDKCILLCANCHAEEHARLGGWAGR